MAPPARPRHPFLDWPGPAAFAHRGGAAEAPENTLPAFKGAVDLGFHFLETDARVTTDGVVVAFHDDDLSRTCNRPGFIHELPWSEVATARVDGREPIPRMIDVLEAFPEVRLNVDCKSDDVVVPLCDLLASTPGSLDRVCVGSFKAARLRQVRRRLGHAVCTSYAPVELTLLRFLGLPWPDVQAVQAPVRWHGIPLVTPSFVKRCHHRGVEVHVWTIDEASEMERLLDMGVDGIMTDQPTRLRSVLQARGQWVG